MKLLPGQVQADSMCNTYIAPILVKHGFTLHPFLVKNWSLHNDHHLAVAFEA